MTGLQVDYGTRGATFVADPPHGNRVVFEVDERDVAVGRYRARATRFVVQLRGSTGEGFSSHVSYEAACRAALSRARRYMTAYSVPRGIPGTRVVRFIESGAA